MKTKADVANYITRCIALSGKSQKRIADEAGFETSNILSMLKTGETKVPIARIPALAKALHTDPKALFDVCLEAYQPELHGVMVSLAPSMLVTSRELAFVRLLRRGVRAGIFS